MKKSSKLNILLISPIPPPVGGDSTWALQYINYCKEHNVDVHIVNKSLIGRRSKNANSSFNLFEEIVRSYNIFANIRKTINFARPNVVHLNTNCSPKGIIRDYISALLAKPKKIPLVLHCHCNVKDKISKSKIGLFFFKKLCKLSKTIIVLNTNSSAFVSKIIGDNALIIPNFVETSFIIKNRVIREEFKNVLFIGHILRYKGISELLQAAKENKELTFTLAGPITEEYNSDEILKNSVGNINLLGSVSPEKVKELLDTSDVFVFPSYTEGFSVALLEAAARGLPIICTDVGANRDLIEDKGGIIIPQKDSNAITYALQMMNYETRKQMSEWNINKIKSAYTIDLVMNRLYKIYNSLIRN